MTGNENYPAAHAYTQELIERKGIKKRNDGRSIDDLCISQKLGFRKFISNLIYFQS